MIYKLFSSLRVRLVVLVLLAVIPALFLILYTAAEQQRSATQEAQDDALRMTRLIAAEEESVVTSAHQLLSSVAPLITRISLESPDCNALFGDLRSRNPQYVNFGLAEPQGRVLCSARALSGSSLADRSFFRQTVDAGRFSIGQYQVDPATGHPVVYFGYPILDTNRQVHAVLFAAMDAQWFGEVANQAQLPKEISVTLFDSTGTILVRYPDPERWLGESYPSSELVRSVLAARQGSFEIPDLDGEPRLFTFTVVQGAPPDASFYLSVGVSRQPALAEANRSLIRNLVWLGIVAVLALAGAWFGGELFILRRVRALLDFARGLMAGNLTVRTGLPYGSGELSDLARVFDQMAEKLEEREAATRRQNRNLSALNSLTASVSATLELPEVLSNLQGHLTGQLEIPGGLIFLYEETKAALFLHAAWGFSEQAQARIRKIPASTQPYKRIIEEKEPLQICDFLEQEPYVSWGIAGEHPDWRYSLSVPLLAKGETQGLIHVFSPDEEIIAPDQVALLSTIGQQVGIVVQNARLFEQIRTGRERLKILSQRFLEVQEAERRHIARELHDQVGQALTALKVTLQSAQRSADHGSMGGYLEESIGMIDRLIQQVRSLSLELRPSLLDDLGIVATIRWYVDRQAIRAGFQAEVIADPPEMRLSPELETTCFRVVQEAITNVVRHAQATRVQVELHQQTDGLVLLIRDNGIGFDVRSARERGTADSSLGLLGMEERVQFVGGDIEIRSNLENGAGTEIHAWFPLTVKASVDRRSKRREIG